MGEWDFISGEHIGSHVKPCRKLESGINMIAIHLIERESLFSRVSGSNTEYQSGYWAVSESDAAKLIGAHIYFHERQIEPSFYGGLITGFHVHQDDPYVGRVVFKFEPKADCRGVRAGRAGWQFEKKLVRKSLTIG
jgi:hypothetical protein